MYDLSRPKHRRSFGLPVSCLALVALLTSGVSAQQTPALPAPAAAPGVPSPVSRQAPVDVLPGDYLLAPDDQLDIAVEDHPEFDKSVVILSNGTFDYFKHHIMAANLTVEQLTQALTQSLKRQLRFPFVTVNVRQAHVRQVSVIGTTHTPGMYNYRPGMRVLDAIADSGGPLQSPELTDATLVTNQGTTSTPVDLVKLMDGTDASLNVPLQPGDILLMQARNPATAMVLIRGQVAHEGQYPVRPEGATIMAMLAQAGGATGSAAITRVQVTHDGQTRVLNLRPTEFDSTAPVGQTKIVAGDSIAVPLNNAKYIVWGEVRNPSVFGLPDGEPTTVTKALALAGTVTPDADMKNLEIVRTTPDGKTQYIPVNEDNVVRNKKNTDVYLQDGDILVVPKRNHANTQGAIQNGIGSLFTFGALSNLLRGF